MQFNITGQPGLGIPAGLPQSRLRLSLRFVGHPFGEAMLYRLAQFYEDADRVDEAPSAGAFRPKECSNA